MKKMMNKVIGLLILVVLISSCKKEEIEKLPIVADVNGIEYKWENEHESPGIMGGTYKGNYARVYSSDNSSSTLLINLKNSSIENNRAYEIGLRVEEFDGVGTYATNHPLNLVRCLRMDNYVYTPWYDSVYNVIINVTEVGDSHINFEFSLEAKMDNHDDNVKEIYDKYINVTDGVATNLFLARD